MENTAKKACCDTCKNSDFCYQNTSVCMFYEAVDEGESLIITAMEEYAEVQNALK